MSSATATAAPPRSRSRARIQPGDYGVLIGLVAIMAYLSIQTTTFLTTSNLVNVVDQMVVVGLLAMGATLCIISGVFDLSVTACLALSTMVAIEATQHLGVPLGMSIGVLAGAALGSVTGLVVVVTRVHSFVATLAISIVYRGIAVIVTAGAIIYPLATQVDAFGALARATPLRISGSTVVLVVMFILLSILLSRTTFGRRVYAVGGNEEAARLSGVRVTRIRVAVFAINGVCASLAGLVLASRAGSGSASMATGVELTAIAAAIIGGTSILGGEGAIWRAVVGTALLTLISNGFNLLGWDTVYQQVVQGALILIAVTTDQILRRRGT